MTTPFRHYAKCPHCGYRVPLETPFNGWFRSHPEFHSVRKGITRFDLDLLLHRYKFIHDGMGARTVQCMMFVEVKTNGAELTPAQQDSLSVLSQVMRNRRPNNPLRNGRRVKNVSRALHARGHSAIAVVFSRMTKKRHALRLFGGHLLRLESETPETSQWMLWDDKAITVNQLVKLFLFEYDPDKIRPFDPRRRYRSVKTLTGWTCRCCGEEFDDEMWHCPLCNQHRHVGMLCECEDGNP